MTVNLSFIGGAGWQFFTDDGVPLSGGKLYTYAAGTTTPLTTYTSRTADTPNTNPIILDAAGRTPQQIWSTEGLLYKYVIKDANDVLIRSWDNIGGTVVSSDLAANLANTTDNTKGDALIGFRQSSPSGFLTGATARTVSEKLQESVSVFDFMTTAQIADVQARTALVDVTAPLQMAIDAACAAQTQLFWPRGVYYITASLVAKSKTNWLGEGGTYSVVKGSGIIGTLINDDDSNMEDVIIDSMGFDFNGFNTTDFATALSFNATSHTRFRIVNNRIFDSNYPGDGAVKQRQGIFIGSLNTDIWVLNNDLSAGARIKVGRGGRNVFIRSNKLNFINDNGITMAMRGTAALPEGNVTENVHIEDNIIINPAVTGIFIGADGEDKTDPAMYVKNVIVARNIIYMNTPYTGQEGTFNTTPRGFAITAPSGGVYDLSVVDNTIVMTNVTPNFASEVIRVGAADLPVGTMDRVTISRNKIYTPYKNQTGIYVGPLYAINDLVISDNIIDGANEAVYLRTASTINRPVVTGNITRNCARPFRIAFNPVVVAGVYARNRDNSPTAAAIFSSSNAMEWRIDNNEILDSAAAALDVNGAGVKDLYIINNDFRGSVTGPITFTSSGVLSENSARLDNLGDTALITIASAATITLPHVRFVSISGTTNIDTITATGRAGQVVVLRFAGILTVNDNTGNLRLAGNFTTTANDTLTLACTGTEWEEVSRSVN